MKAYDYSNTQYYENRELSWLKFNERVLSEARDNDNPLFERLKFLSITSSNLDEFIMVRIASLIDMESAGIDKVDIAGMTPKEQRKALNVALHKFVADQYEIYNSELVPALKEHGINIVDSYEDLSAAEKIYVEKLFENEVYPVLTPMAVDSSRPFPLISNRSLNIGALVRPKNKEGEAELEFATVQVPSVLPRIVELPVEDEGSKSIIFLEKVIEKNMDKLFLNYDIVCSSTYRISRSADLSIDEDEAEDLLKEIEKQVRMRKWGAAIRLEVSKEIDDRLLTVIKDDLLLKDKGIFKIDGPLDLTLLMQMYAFGGYDHLKEHSYESEQPFPYLSDGCDIFAQIRNQDMLLIHPFQSFKPIVNFIEQAANDSDVLAIKQTLYRVSGNSPIVAALAKAADNGKQVTVLVELKARFDEENNIIWAKRLERAGCHVIYGLVGLKTHSKITLVVRREEDGIKRYVHLGTGNYNDSTAKLYTDIGLLTADESIGEDATAVFNMLSGYSEPRNWNKLSLAPLWLKDRFLFLIEREKEHAQNGEKARIIAKMNSICDPDVIKALYEAASVGVKIDLIVRGICCMKLDTPGLDGNIKIRSIVGNFLEHARIFYFENGGKSEYYCSSADWMPRNLERRVEILFPIEKEELRGKLEKILKLQLNDNVKAHILSKDGIYIPARVADRNDPDLMTNSQLELCKLAKEEAALLHKNENSRVFIPRTSEE